MHQRGIWKIPKSVAESKEAGPLHDQALNNICVPPLTAYVSTLSLPSG